MSNHLGNVLSVIGDQKLPIVQSGVVQSFVAYVISSQDYSPFGVTLSGRSWSGEEYRYGYNGKEIDDEGMGGGGNTYDYGFRIYNPALAKFLSVDPLSSSFAWLTPYQFAGLTPITSVDLDGLEPLDFRALPNSPEKASCHGTTPLKYVDDKTIVKKVDLNEEIVHFRNISRVESMSSSVADWVKLTSGGVNAYWVSAIVYTITTTEQHLENWEMIGDVLVTTVTRTITTLKFGSRYTEPSLYGAIFDQDLGSMEAVVESVTEETDEFFYYQKVLDQDENSIEASNSETAGSDSNETKSAQRDDSNFNDFYNKLPDDVKKEVVDILDINGKVMNSAIKKLPGAGEKVKKGLSN
ncbi:MAG: RHS repeat-associated core domain-containing protein [Flavobacteriales bacterium]